MDAPLSRVSSSMLLFVGRRVDSSGCFFGAVPVVAVFAFAPSFTDWPPGSVPVDGSYNLLHTLWSTVFWSNCVCAPLLLLDAQRLFDARLRSLSRSRDPAMESHVSRSGFAASA